MKLFYLDTETTGVQHWRNSVHQISGYIEIDGVLKEEFDFNVQPHPKAIIETEALEVSGVTEEQIKGYPPQKTVHAKITKMLDKYVDKFDSKDKFFIVGYNAIFDVNFFRAFFKQCSDHYYGSYFWSGCLDVMVMALEHLKHERHEMENFKLKTVASKLGIQVVEENLHDAMYDIELTRDAYKILTNE